jgi:hypothetical protein
MTTPAPRTPVRPGRGTKANLNTALAAGDIKEGEIVYAKDEDKLYVVESGAFVAIGGGGGGAVDSVNGQVGTVVLDLEDLDNVGTAVTVYVFDSEQTAAVNLNANGDWQYSFNELMFYQNDANGLDFLTPFAAKPQTGTFYVSTDGVNFTPQAYTYHNEIASRPAFGVVSTNYAGAGTIYFAFEAPGASNGQVLSWDSVASQWTPSDRRGAIQFVGISSSLEAVYDQATLSHTLPSNIKKGDLILLYVGHRSGTASTTSLLNTPSGYTKRTERTYTSTSSTSSSISHTLFTKIAVGNESGTTVSVTAVTSTAGDDWYAASQVYRNAEYVAVSTEDTVAAPGGLQTGYATVTSLTDYNVLYSAHAINVYAFSTNHAHRFLTETGLEMRHLQPLVNVPAAKRQHSWYQTAGIFKVAAANSADYFDTATVANLTDGFHFMFTKLKPA